MEWIFHFHLQKCKFFLPSKFFGTNKTSIFCSAFGHTTETEQNSAEQDRKIKNKKVNKFKKHIQK